MEQEELKKLLHYDPDTGVFTWLKSNARSVKIGSLAGCDDNGYIRITINKKKYLAHKLAWLYVYSEFPSKSIDHINRIKNDNRIINLRQATNSENSRNRGKLSTNKSGFKGVYFSKQKRKFRACILIEGKYVHLGYFETPELAANAYSDRARIHHGEFCCLI